MAFKSFLEVNGVQTAVACWGQWVEEQEPDEVIICLTGNPGIAEFYHPYLEKVHHLTNIPTWVIGHAGHEEPITGNSTFLKKIGPIKGRESLFNLQGQLDQKVEFVKKYTKSTTKIHLLGHSVGAWIAINMLKNEQIKDRIVSSQLLFPTIQKIASTPNGFFLNNILRRVTPIILMLLWILNNFIPMFIYVYAVKFFCYIRSYPNVFEKPIIKYLYTSATVVDKILFMAYDEMDCIKKLDVQILTENKDNIKIIYNKKDKWAPGSLFKDFPKMFPGLYIQEVDYDHAFVLKSSEKMAELTASLIPK